ncbi:MAG: PfkB family carbohydrate kinase, partial [Bacteroidota bacterium]
LGFNKGIYTVPSIEIKTVDTTGAGDAFVGAVLYQLSQKTVEEMKSLSKENWGHIIYNANKAGARTCEYMGAMEAFRYLNNEIFK